MGVMIFMVKYAFRQPGSVKVFKLPDRFLLRGLFKVSWKALRSIPNKLQKTPEESMNQTSSKWLSQHLKNGIFPAQLAQQIFHGE
jgi:hypothetical protein